MALWRTYYHLIRATDERRPLITPIMEPQLYGYMIGKAVALGAIVHAIGGIETHTHVVASIPPKLAIADFVQNVKGSSSHHMNHGPVRHALTFGWQRGYGVYSLGSKQLDNAIAYTLCQKEHHQQNTINPLLERDDNEDDGPDIWNNGQAIQTIPIIKA